MQQRYYDPLLGRFLSVDPVTAYSSSGANFNRYWYANNNVYRFMDPDGRLAQDDKPPPSEPSPPPPPSRKERAEQREQERLANQGWSVTSFELPTPPQGLVDGVAGFGDALSLGLTKYIRDENNIGSVDYESMAYDVGEVSGTAYGAVLGGVGAAKTAGAVFGPMKQWVRIGPSYSRELGQQVRLSLRWGASPARGGKYLQQIPNETMRSFNQWIRQQKLPGGNWRIADPGHFHLWLGR
jgi:uncharacterized protein RhaS with RHS repeats